MLLLTMKTLNFPHAVDCTTDALKTAKSCNKSPVEDICSIKELIKMYENFWSDEEKQACAVELLEHIVHEYEQRVKVLDATRIGHDEELLLLDCSV